MKNNLIRKTNRLFKSGFILAAGALLGLGACSQESDGPVVPATRAIELKTAIGEHTRAADPKENFQPGDVIHVFAEFTLDGGGNSDQYACMEFDGNQWKAKDNTALNWPWNAEKATFTAYYLPPVGEQGKPGYMPNSDKMNNETGKNVLSFSLTDLTNEAVKNGTDPLTATCTDVPVEGAVYLQFRHLFTKLTLINLGTTETFNSRITDGMQLKLSATGLTDQFSVIREQDGNKISHALQSTDTEITGVTESKSGNGAPYRVTFLLPSVDDASGIDYRLSFRDYSPYHGVPIGQKLESGKHYTVNVTQLVDNYIAEELQEEQWNGGQAVSKVVLQDINAYLTAIANGQEYIENNIQILALYQEEEKTVVTQLVDVDFDNEVFDPVNLTANIVFQGNLRKILNVNGTKVLSGNQAIFGSNAGVIKNLVIEGANMEDAAAATQIGILAGQNSGTISNVRIRFNTGDKIENTGNASYIGGLVGYNTGNIDNCTLEGGPFTIEVTGAYTGSVHVGGLIGYNSGPLSFSKVQTAAGSKIDVDITGDITAYTGGCIGFGQNRVNGCSSSLDVMVVAKGTVQAGGFAGMIYNQVTDCFATGNVVVEQSAKIIHAGGWAGHVCIGVLNGCFATGEVSLAGSETPEEVNVAGFAGWTSYQGTGNTSIVNCYAVGAVPAADAYGFTAKISNVNSSEGWDETKVSIQNSFSKNDGSDFAKGDPGDLAVILKNYHHNGEQGSGNSVTASELNQAPETGWFEWQDSPALYGADIPYLTRTPQL